MDGCVACWLLLVCPWQSVVCAVINPSILSEFSNDYKLCKHVKTIDKVYTLIMATLKQSYIHFK